MEYSVSFLPWLIPCAGAGLTVALSANISARARRRIQAGILLGTCIALALLQRVAHVMSPPRPFMDQFERLAFSYDQPRTTVAWLPLGLFTLLNLGLIIEPLERYESGKQLALVGMTLATMAASNPFTLGIIWGITDLLLLALKIRQVRPEELYPLIRHGASNLFSTLALIVAIAFMGEWGDIFSSTHIFAGLPRMSLPWLALAGFFRLGVYPLPHRHGAAWEMDLTSLFTGIYLWLQVSMLQSLPLAHPLVLLISLCLLAMGLLTNCAPDFSSGWPYVSMYSILLALLPMLVGGAIGTGATLALVALWALGLTLRHLYIRASVPRNVVPWARAPMIAALAALSGLPLSLGFMARWSLLQICWLYGRWDIILIVSTASLLISIPLWRQLDELLTFFGNYERPQGMELIPIGVTALLAMALMVGGIWPGTGTTLGLSIRPFSSIVLFLLTLIPSLGGYTLHKPQRRSYAAPWVKRLAPTLELEWLYVGGEKALERVDAWIVALYTTLEDALGLGWILMWALALALYLVER